MDALLLVNLGTPRSPSPSDVREYLTEFLTDGRVLDIPFVQRQLLARGVIIPRRAKTSAKSYQAIWTEGGSPLLVYGKKVKDALQKELPNVKVALGMRYGSPSIEEALEELKGALRLVVIPLFPQYASATTGSVHQEVMRLLSGWESIPELHLIRSYPRMEEMIEAIQERAKAFTLSSYDEILFSFHGLPKRQLKKAGCCFQMERASCPCYASECYATASLIQNKLGIQGRVTFQSRLGKEPWIEPYTADVVKSLAHQGKKRILVFSPAFVADCLETLYELGVELKQEFIEEGGEVLDFVPSLNDHPLWVKGLLRIAREALLKKAPQDFCLSCN